MKYFYFGSMHTHELLQYLLPTEMLDFFDLVAIEKQGDKLVFFLDEKHTIPSDFPEGDYEAKGFTEGKSLLDFPLRDKAVLLFVRRRKWLDKKTGKILTSTWELTTEGTK